MKHVFWTGIVLLTLQLHVHGVRATGRGKRSRVKVSQRKSFDEPIICLAVPCPAGQFRCNNCACVMTSYVCDGENDCGDGSDEKPGCVAGKCKGSEFMCGNGRCIPISSLCDGSADCTDNSDEFYCAESPSSCGVNEYRCASTNRCLPLSKLCAGYVTCLDTTQAYQNQCRNFTENLKPCTSASCLRGPEHQCSLQNDPVRGVSLQCDCAPGYMVDMADTSQCVDYNECEKYGRCDQKCHNLPGSFKCTCSNGYTMMSSGKCQATNASEPAVLYVGTNKHLSTMNLEGAGVSHMINSSINSFDIDVHPGGPIYWVNADDKKVYSHSPGQPGHTVVPIQGLVEPLDIAWDWLARNLYIACSSRRILVYSTAAQRQRTLVSDGIINMGPLAVDPGSGSLFYSDEGGLARFPAKIVRAYMDGSQRHELKLGKIKSVSSISIDVPARRIYWTDRKMDVLETTDYFGLNRQRIVSGYQNIPSPVGLTMFEDLLFYADNTKMAVMVTNKFRERNADVTPVWQTVETVTSVKVRHAVLQQTSVRENPCLKTRCAHLCVLSHVTDNDSRGYRCQCEAGYQLYKDGVSCQQINEFLLFSTKFAVRGVPLTTNSSHAVDAMKLVTPLDRSPAVNLVAVDYEAANQMLYFSDLSKGAIYRTSLNSDDLRYMPSSERRTVEGLSVDWVSHLLYFTNQKRRTLEVLSLKHANQTRVLLRQLGSPRSVVVHPTRGYVFFADWLKTSTHFPYIGRCHGDGSHVTKIHRYELAWPNGMCLDFTSDRLYWVEAFFDRLQHTDLDGQDLQTVPGIKIVHPFGVAVFKGSVYLTDWKLQAISRVNVTSGETTVMMEGVQQLRSLQVYSPDLQKIPADHPCGRDNGGCSHFCFSTPAPMTPAAVLAVCACPYGQMLTADNKTCVDNPAELASTGCRRKRMFQCSNGRCINAKKRCNGVQDCVDNSDELYCPEVVCGPTHFLCKNGKCLRHPPWICDGYDDCGDQSDETNCPSKTCKREEFKCNNTLCIPLRQRCDTENDCRDGSDEGATCDHHRCLARQFQCKNQRCIELSQWCDGQEDCPMGEDEDVSKCPPWSCHHEREWQCVTGRQCIHSKYRCDGAPDCRDGSDELHCPARPAGGCFGHEFQCGDGGGCIPDNWKCDGQPDCADLSDETQCGALMCGTDSLACSNGTQCVLKVDICAGTNTCSDENILEYYKVFCATESASCRADEWACPRYNHEAITCINISRVCDDKPDCPRALDEGPACDLSQTECVLDNGGCSHQCLATPNGVVCQCLPGYELENTTDCVDIDECMGATVCDQMCVNTAGSYKCECVEGYTSYSHGHYCAAAAEEAKVFVTTGAKVTALQPNLKYSNSYWFKDARDLSGIDFHYKQRQIYVSDSTTRKIYSMNLETEKQSEVIPWGVGVIEDIAVDWVGSNLYWTDSSLQTIEVATLNGADRVMLFSENVTRPSGIELDPRPGARYLFWSDLGPSPSIYRSGLDGSGRLAIVSTALYQPSGLSLDLIPRRLYFVDSRLGTIEYCNYDGSGRHRLTYTHNHLWQPRGLVVFEDHVSWIDHTHHRLNRCNKISCTDRTASKELDNPIGVTVYHPVRQLPVENPCAASPCSHLCLLSPTAISGYLCKCPLGMELRPATSTTCMTSVSNYLLYSTETGLSMLPLSDLSSQGHSPTVLPLVANRNIVTMATGALDNKHSSDEYLQRILFLEKVTDKKITFNTMNLATPNISLLSNLGYLGNPSSIAFDIPSGNIFVADIVAGTIEVVRQKNGVWYRKTILANTGNQMDSIKPSAIVTDYKSELYWADMGGAGFKPKIATMHMDGSGRQTINQRRVDFPTALALDYDTLDLYWVEGRRHQIMRWRSFNRRVTVLVDDIGEPQGVAVFDHKLYYADNSLETINTVSIQGTGGIEVIQRNVGHVNALATFQFPTGSESGCHVTDQDYGGCSQICLPSPGSYLSRECHCGQGYHHYDNGTCIAVNSFLLVATSSLIRGFELDNLNGTQRRKKVYKGDSINPIEASGGRISLLDVHMAGNHIYWVESPTAGTVGGIHRVMANGTGHQHVVVEKADLHVKGIAIDWLAGNLYFTNARGTDSMIEVSRLDGSHRLVIVQDRINSPTELAVNPVKRYLYWIDEGQYPKIEHSYLDGTNRNTLVTSGVLKPRGITVDIETHNVYWTDVAVDAIQMVSFSGGRRQFVQGHLPNPVSLTVISSSILWVDASLNSLFLVNKRNNGNRKPKLLRKGLSGLTAVTMFTDLLQPTVSGPCSVENGGCEHLCFALPGAVKASCACSFGQLTMDNRTCQIPDVFLLYSTSAGLETTSAESQLTTSTAPPSLTWSHIVNSTSVDFDYNTGMVYYVNQQGGLRSYNKTANSTKLYRNTTDTKAWEYSVTTVTYDWLDKRVFWSSGRSVYSKSSSQGEDTGTDNQTIVYTAVYPIVSLAAFPCRRWLFVWMVKDHLYRVNYDGTDVRLLDCKTLGASSLTIDYEAEMLYFVDDNSSPTPSIRRCSMDGQMSETIVTRMHPVGVTVYQQYIYWTDWLQPSNPFNYKGRIYRAEKNTGDNLEIVAEGINRGTGFITVYWNRSSVCGQVPSPCVHHNGGCTDHCRVNATLAGAECYCDPPDVLSTNGRTCHSPSTNQNIDCPADMFRCRNNKCISVLKVCDGKLDCRNHGDSDITMDTDENIHFCAMRACDAGYFRCSSGQCIPDAFRCDHDNDCPEGEDELDCVFPECASDQFRCSNGRCLVSSLVCDGMDNCLDGTDELHCNHSAVLVCKEGYVKCPGEDRCIARRYWCDGEADCENGYDELPGYCVQHACDKGWFKCSQSHRCVPASWVCDGERDCGTHGEDELECKSVLAECAGFHCGNGKCLSRELVCDGLDDCGDNSDEKLSLNCQLKTCPNHTFACEPSHINGSFTCLSQDKVCDGVNDCVEGQDERGCPVVSCEDEYFTCNSGQCVPDTLPCDHIPDCEDGTDEGDFCNYKNCSSSEFRCKNGRCIPQHWSCDKKDDCLDMSDEDPSICAGESCPNGSFKCTNKKCINQSAVCNRIDDCSDWSDEERCGINECANPRLNRCSHMCIDLPIRYKCACGHGYKLLPDKLFCIDEDECTASPGICDQVCVNTGGSYMCKCNDGYMKHADGHTCKPIENITPWLIFTNRFYIREITTDGKNYRRIAEDFGNVVAMDILYEEETLFFVDVKGKAIQRMKVDGSNLEAVVKSGIKSPEGLAVDWVARKLYWIDAKDVAIFVSNLNGTSIKTLLRKSLLKRPRAIVVNPFTGYAYWTDWTRDSYIGCIGMDGTEPHRLISQKLGWPNALTIDYETNRLWWADAHLDWIEYADADGSNRHVVRKNVPHPFAIAVFENWLYWTDWNHLTIERCDKYTGGNFTVLLNTTHRPMDIHIYHPLKQKPGRDPCGVDNGGCSHLCLIAPGGTTYTCACPDNFLLGLDNRTCTANCTLSQIRCGPMDDRCIPRMWKCDGVRDCKDGADEPLSCPSTRCSPGQFPCRNGECVYQFQTCDLLDQCGDSSDEDWCEENTCKPWQFLCDNHKCIPAGWKCDGTDDCGDGSDEANTICKHRSCESSKFQCDNGRCIPQAWQCDFDDDCGDNSDEKPDFGCNNRTCKPGWWRCESNYRCIPDWLRCNGKDDCRDNSDEIIDNCPRCHPTGDFHCKNKRCVPKRWMCDFDNDCGDNSDEDPDMCAPLYRNCSETEVRCSNQKCIRAKWRCDHDNDCGDNSDETLPQCALGRACLEDEVRCHSGECIPHQYTCDGVGQCRDASDEHNCSTSFRYGYGCHQGMFQCDNNLCVPSQWRCDGQDDCGDQSDESKVSCDQVTCPINGHLLCSNRKCVPLFLACDGVDHCGDFSDENTTTLCRSVPVERKECSVQELRCGNGRCVPSDVICDHGNDCGDGTDEMGCDKSNSSEGCSTNNGGCEHNCTDVIGGHYCSCHPGFKVDTLDKTSCEDIDECTLGNHTCPQLCSNVKGSYKCLCAPGFKDSKGQGQDCKPEEAARSVLFSTLTQVRRYRPDKKEYSGAIIEGQNVGYMDLDIGKELMYWTDARAGSIYRAPIPELAGRQGIPQNIGITSKYPYAIAVDWVQDNVYWSDLKEGRIYASLFDGRYQVTIATNITLPLAIALNPKLGLMYWTEGDPANPRIERAWMNGQERTVIVSSRLLHPAALTIDYTMYDRVYFADSKLGVIESMKADGSDRKLIIRHVHSPVSVDVFESKVYWVSQRDGSAHYQDKFGRGNSTILQTSLVYPGSVRVFHRMRVDLEVKSRCPRSGDSCSHVCLLVPDGFQCACPDGTAFQEGSKFICQAAVEVAKPVPKMCACWHGGQCIQETGSDNYTCLCPAGYSGPLCEVIEPRRLSAHHENNYLLPVVIPTAAIFTLVLAVLVTFVVKYRRTMQEKEDPATVTYTSNGNVEMAPSNNLQQSSLSGREEGSCTNFSNPLYETCQGDDPGVYTETSMSAVTVVTSDDKSLLRDVSEVSLDNTQAEEHENSGRNEEDLKSKTVGGKDYVTFS